MGAKLGGGSGRRGRRGGQMSDINVTPFVDVMLVLLVIFMVAAPLMTAGVAVDLPRAKAASISQEDNAPLEISLDAKGNIFVGDTKLSQPQMVERLRMIAAEVPDRRVYIRADRKLDYGRVMTVMADVNGAGFSKIALISDPAGK